MKAIKIVVPLMLLLALAFAFSGCPGKSMQSDMSKSDTMMDK